MANQIMRSSLMLSFQENLAKYERWSSSTTQADRFFGKIGKPCYAVHLKTGDTMLIPSGWIHSVCKITLPFSIEWCGQLIVLSDTSSDSIVIGGNFLHHFGSQIQVEVYRVSRFKLLCTLSRDDPSSCLLQP
jgi:hypothetical protein